MTLTTKKSRPITIDGMKYRYQVSTSRITEDWSFSLNLTVQNFDLKGSVLQVMGLITRDFWLDFSDGPKWSKSDYPVITPKHISEIIKHAILIGWEPNKTGITFKLDTSNDKFFNFSNHTSCSIGKKTRSRSHFSSVQGGWYEAKSK